VNLEPGVRKLILAPAAQTEISEASDWYEQQRPGLGIEFVAAVEATLSAIRQNPFQYQTLWGKFRSARLHRFPYSLIYGVSDQRIIVASCFHGRRNPKSWKDPT
jgi:plasmid stabilization system protein ParE